MLEKVKNSNNYSNNTISLQRQLFNLNNLSTNELRLKWSELYNNLPNNFKRAFLIKGIASIQNASSCWW